MGEKNTKINPKMQTNNHSNATNAKPVSDYSFVAMDDYQTSLLSMKNTGVAEVFPPPLKLDRVDSGPSKPPLLTGLI